MPDVLGMSTLQLGYPLPLGVLLELDDSPPHAPSGAVFVRAC